MAETKVIYIAGAGRSGSTLLDAILGEIDDAFSLGEARLLWKHLLRYEKPLCSCGEAIDDCPFWKQVLLKLFNNSLPSKDKLEKLYYLQKIVENIPILNYYKRNKYLLQNKNELKKYSDFILNFYKTVAEISGCKILIDSSKLPHYLYVLKDLPIELYIIHLVRDPRGVAYSWTKEKYHPALRSYMKRHHPFTSARLWNIYNLGILNFKHKNYHLIKYEDLTNNIQASLTCLTHAFNFKPFFNFEKKIFLFKKKHLVGGNPVRLSFKKEIYIKKDIDWHKKLPLKYKFLVTLLTFPLLKKFKYPIFKHEK